MTIVESLDGILEGFARGAMGGAKEEDGDVKRGRSSLFVIKELRPLFHFFGEWCRDTFVDAVPGGKDPSVREGGPDRVFRGGSWKMNGRFCRSAFRNGTDPNSASKDLGFRVVLDHFPK